MKKSLASILLLVPFASYAALDVGDAAPNFTVPAALGGKVYTFKLSDSLAKGPVVLYFFPAAFSVGCSIEAHEFAESMAKFEALGATVIGVSSDDIDTLGKFSVQACQGRFPVASDSTQSVMKSRLRQPRLVRHRTERQGRLQLPEPEPEPPRRKDARRAQGLADQEMTRTGRPAGCDLLPTVHALSIPFRHACCVNGRIGWQTRPSGGERWPRRRIPRWRGR
jgi:hypothetical protein